MSVRDVVIVGSGPAGYTAALYTARASLKPLLIEGVQYGGALMNTTDVENFPGFPDGVMGPELMDMMRKQAERFGAEIITDDATARRPVRHRQAGHRSAARATRPRTVDPRDGLGVPRARRCRDEKRLSGHGVSWCATCDGFFFRGKDIAVVGGGDSAVEEATFLTRFAESVTIVHRRDALRASKIMADRALTNPKISFAWNSVVEEVLGEDSVTGLALRDVDTGETSHPRRRRRVRRDRPRPAQRADQGPGRPRRRGVRPRRRPAHPDQPSRRVRVRRPGRPHLSSGHHRRRRAAVPRRWTSSTSWTAIPEWLSRRAAGNTATRAAG